MHTRQLYQMSAPYTCMGVNDIYVTTKLVLELKGHYDVVCRHPAHSILHKYPFEHRAHIAQSSCILKPAWRFCTTYPICVSV